MNVRGFGRDLNLVLASFFLCIFGYVGLHGFLGPPYMLRLGYDVTFVAQATSVNTLTWCVLSLPAGFLVSRWGLRRSMFVGLLLCAVKLAVFAFVELLPAGLRGAALVACMVPGGVGGALYLACVIPCLMEAETSKRTAALSANSMAGLVATSLGSLAGGALTALSTRLTASPESSPAPYRLGLTIAVVAQIGSAVCVAFMRATTPGRTASETAHEPRPSTKARAPGSVLAVAAVTTLLVTILSTSLGTFLSLHLDRSFKIPTQSIGTALAIANGVPALAFLMAPVLVKRLGRGASPAMA